MVELNRYILDQFGGYLCVLCDRLFPTLHAVETHCRMTTRHAWCDRCKRVFRFQADKLKHLEESRSHNICRRCSRQPDFPDLGGLYLHREDVHNWCRDCDIYYATPGQRRQHNIVQHNMCDLCGNYFSSDNALRMVSIYLLNQYLSTVHLSAVPGA